MNVVQRRRLYYVGVLIVSTIVVVWLIIQALQENINLFYKPGEILQGAVKKNVKIRVGGVVKPGSVIRGKELEVQFNLMDFPQNSSKQKSIQTIPVDSLKIIYKGILPDLFKEGQGIVATGELLSNQIFLADEVLAKHDENYKPPELQSDS